MEQSNAARRLCNILECALADKDNHQLVYQALASALGIQNPDANKHLFTEFFVLLAEVERIVKQLKQVDNLERYVSTVQEIQSIFFTYSIFQGKWDSAKATIENRNLILLLDACANFIAQEKINFLLIEEQLQEYLQQCEALLQELMHSELDEDIKTFLIISLEEICTSIRHYAIGGSERLQMVVEANIGGIILHSAKFDSQNINKPILKKTLSWLLTFGAILGCASDTQNYLIPKIDEIIAFLALHNRV